MEKKKNVEKKVYAVVRVRGGNGGQMVTVKRRRERA